MGAKGSAAKTKAQQKSSKAGHRKFFRQHPAGPVAVVSSIKFRGTVFEDRFCNGLGDYTTPPVYEDQDAAYGGTHTELDKAVLRLNADKSVKLIVAVGGLPAADAVARKATTPYLVLVGTDKTTTNLNPNTLLRGGVTLGNPELNVAGATGTDPSRNQALLNQFPAQVTAPKNVCLIYNDNNKILSGYEVAQWKNKGWPVQAGATGGNNTTAGFANALVAAKAGGAQAVVISSDPFFTENADDLVKAVNNSGLCACYPFQRYRNAIPYPDNSIWYGPDLLDAYRLLGQIASLILPNTGASLPLKPAPILGPAAF